MVLFVFGRCLQGRFRVGIAFSMIIAVLVSHMILSIFVNTSCFYILRGSSCGFSVCL